MRQKLRSHLRHNVVGYIALFVALGGTGAYASHLVVNSSDVVNESLLSQDVKGNNGTPTTAAVNGTLTGADVSGQPARPSVGQPFVDGSLTTSDIKKNSLTGADVNESTLGTVPNASKVGGIAPSALTIGRAATGSCDPDDGIFRDCGSLTVNLTRTSRVLIVTSAMWYSDTPITPQNPSNGTCRIGVNGAPFGPNVFPGELHDESGSQLEHSLTLTNVTPALSPGNHTFGLACNQIQGNIVFPETMISVVVLGSA